MAKNNNDSVVLDPEWEWLRPVTIDRSNGYAAKRLNGKKQTVHRIVMNAQPGQIVDHINRNKPKNSKTLSEPS